MGKALSGKLSCPVTGLVDQWTCGSVLFWMNLLLVLVLAGAHFFYIFIVLPIEILVNNPKVRKYWDT